VKNLPKPVVYGLETFGFLVLLVAVAGVVVLITSSGGPVLNASVAPPPPPSVPVSTIVVPSPVPPAALKATPTTPPKPATGDGLRKQKLQDVLVYGGQALLILDNSAARTNWAGAWKDRENGPIDIGPSAYLDVHIFERDPSAATPTLVPLKPGQLVYARDGKVVELADIVTARLSADELEKRFQVAYPPETVNLSGNNIPFDDGEDVTILDVVTWNAPRGPQAALVKIARKDQVLWLGQNDFWWYVETWHGLCGWRSTRHLTTEDIGRTFRANIWRGNSPSEGTLVLADVLPDPEDSATLDLFSRFVDYLRRNNLAVVDFAGMDAPAPQYVQVTSLQGVALAQVFGNEWARVLVLPEDNKVVLTVSQPSQVQREVWSGTLNPGDTINYKGRLALGNEKLCRLVNRGFFNFSK